MFKEIRGGAMLNTEGAISVLIMGMDGSVLERVWQSAAVDVKLEIAVAEYTSLMRGAKRANANVGLGDVFEPIVSSENGI